MGVLTTVIPLWEAREVCYSLLFPLWEAREVLFPVIPSLGD